MLGRSFVSARSVPRASARFGGHDLARGLTYPEDRHGLHPAPGVRARATRLVAHASGARAAGSAAMLAGAQATAAVLHLQVVGRAVVERCHGLGVPVLAWTAESAEQVRALDRLGVDAVIADDPRIFGS